MHLTTLLLLLAHTRAAIVDPPSLSERLDLLYEKLEKFSSNSDQTTPNLDTFSISTERPGDKLYEKLDRLNSLSPDKFMSDDEEDLLDAMQEWGMLDEQIGTVVKDLQRMKSEEGDYVEWNDEDLQDLTDDDYAMDGSEDLEPDDEEVTSVTTAKSLPLAETSIDRTPGLKYTNRPSALNRLETVMVSAVDPIEATRERPRILDDSALSKLERASLRRAAINNMAAVVHQSKCLTPQPRWLSVRQMAPAADTLYMPPCVQLHRCAPDAGCCYSEAEVCAPVDGEYITLPFFLSKVDGTLTPARMQFFNHTRCECVSKETLQSQRPVTQPARVQGHQQTRIRAAGLGSAGNARQSDGTTQEPGIDETVAPPLLRRCTCPALFMARTTDGCSCVCEWAEPNRRRDCLSLARGREHFGLRDRVCVGRGDCNPPSCLYGAYEKSVGRCPLKRYKRHKYTTRRFTERTVV